MSHSTRRRAFTLIELLVVIAIMSILMGLLLPAVQRVRESANRTKCHNNLKQIGIALVAFHDLAHVFPPGLGALNDGRSVTVANFRAATVPPNLRVHSWIAHILPQLEQQNVFDGMSLRPDDPLMASQFGTPTSDTGTTIISTLICPSDPRGSAINSRTGLTYYAGVGGTDSAWSGNWPNSDGMLYWRSRVGFRDVRDGASQTFLVGERPPSKSAEFGLWQSLDTINWNRGGPDWEFDTIQYTSNTDIAPFGSNNGTPCIFPAYFRPGRFDNNCDFNHFWSNHPGGAAFLFVDGSVRFVTYNSQSIMNALATRNGGEVISLTEY